MTFNALIKKLFQKTDTKDVAKKRLKFALIYDKLEVSDDLLKNLQQDLVEVISRYFEIDRDAINIDIRRSEENSALVFNTPIVSARHCRESSPA